MSAPTPAGLVARARTSIVMGSPFYGSLVVRAPAVPDLGIPTACTDGRTVRYSPAYVLELGKAGTVALFLHEVLHCALGHLWRGGTRHEDPKLWNIACDHVVNLLIAQSGLKVDGREVAPHPNWYCDSRFAGMSAEKVYDILKQEVEQSGGGGCLADDHSSWQQGSGKPSSPDLPEGQAEAEWRQAVVSAVGAAKGRGTLPVGIAQAVEDIIEPRLPWRAVLSRFLTSHVVFSDYSYRRPSQLAFAPGRYAILPRLGVEGGEVVFAIDTSGSIASDPKLLGYFLAEVRSALAMVPEVTARAVIFDHAIQGVYDLASGEDLPTDPPGGGGTSFQPVFDLVAEKVEAGEWDPQAIVFLTDLWGSFPEEAPSIPVLWVSTEGEEAPFGEVTKIEVEGEAT